MNGNMRFSIYINFFGRWQGGEVSEDEEAEEGESEEEGVLDGASGGGVLG